MSESGEIIRRLAEAGVNYETVGRAVGRNRSLIRQIGIGRKPGENLTQSLRELEERLGGLQERQRANAELRAAQVTPPSKRQRKAGGEAKVRRPATVQGRSGSWSSTTMKKQASQSGAAGAGRVIRDAAERGQSVAVTVGFGPGAHVIGTSPTHRGRTPTGHVGARPHTRGQARAVSYVEMNLGDARDVLDNLKEHASFTDYVVAEARANGYVSGGGAGDVRELEVRTF